MNSTDMDAFRQTDSGVGGGVNTSDSSSPESESELTAVSACSSSANSGVDLSTKIRVSCPSKLDIYIC